ncbi:hypothetical protein AAC387_Pa01g1254 [Persea americana]
MDRGRQRWSRWNYVLRFRRHSAGEGARVCNKWNVVEEEERVLSCCVQVREEKMGKKRKRRNKKESVQAGGDAGEEEGEEEEEEERHGGWRCKWRWVCSKEGHAGRRRWRWVRVGGCAGGWGCRGRSGRGGKEQWVLLQAGVLAGGGAGEEVEEEERKGGFCCRRVCRRVGVQGKKWKRRKGTVGFAACGDGCAGQMVMQGGSRGESVPSGWLMEMRGAAAER